MQLTEIRTTGYKARIGALGVLGMLRFLQQLGVGSGNYTSERKQLSEPNLNEFREFIKFKR